jgi:hypothetical protein
MVDRTPGATSEAYVLHYSSEDGRHARRPPAASRQPPSAMAFSYDACVGVGRGVA